MKSRNKGSNTLAGLFATGSGVVFAMLMADVSRYVIARSAVQQAAEQVTRCLTPTDPACVQLSSTPGAQQYDWYGINSGIEATRFADRYNYSGTVKRQQWVVTLPGYEIHKVPLPPVVGSAIDVPVRNFRAALNRYERRVASVQANFDELIVTQAMQYAPLVEPLFPEFHPTYEQQHRYQPATNWAPIALNIPGNVVSGYTAATFVEQSVVDFPITRVPSGSSRMFESEEFEVPELQTGPEITCLNSTGGVCDISYASGGASGDLWQYAHVAIKAFADVKKVGSGSMEIRWAGSPWNNPGTPDGYGLSLVRYSKKRYQQYKVELQAWMANPVGPRPELTAQDEAVDCLGGSAWDEIYKSSWVYHHLVLRGSIERLINNEIDYGVGRSSACPGGDNIHWDLKVERGGAYKIRGWMKARSGSADVKVKYRHFIDSYTGNLVSVTNTSQGSGVCNREIPLSRDNPLNTCNEVASAACNLAPENTVRGCNMTIRGEADCSTPELAASDPGLFELSPSQCGPAVTAALCETTWLPPGQPTCSNLSTEYPGRIVCGWGAEPGIGQTVRISSPTSCPAATSHVNQLFCGDGRGEVTFRPDGDYGPLESCPSVGSYLATNQQLINQINSAQPTGAVNFALPAPETYQWGGAAEFDPPRWSPSVLPIDEFGTPLTDPTVIRNATVERGSIGDIFRRTDSNWHPPLSSFNLTAAELVAASLSSPSYALLSEEDFQLREVYPFANNAEYEIPPFIPNPESLQSCTGDIVPIEDRLRYYANHQIPGIESGEIWFAGAASFADTASILNQSTCSGQTVNVSVPRCSVLSELFTRSVTCRADTYLGRTESTEVPPVCHSGVYSQCRSEYVGGQGATYEESVDQNLAKSAGFRELQRAYPFSIPGCDLSNCSNIEIDLSESDRAGVSVSYNLPISFPLKEIVRADSLRVSAEKEDIRELSLVGRRVD